MNRKVIQTL